MRNQAGERMQGKGIAKVSKTRKCFVGTGKEIILMRRIHLKNSLKLPFDRRKERTIVVTRE